MNIMRTKPTKPAFCPSINFWTMPDTYRQVWENREWKEYILANGTWTMACGHSYNWRSKALGGGIREVWLEIR